MRPGCGQGSSGGTARGLRGIDIDNAVFASNTDNLIALDYSDASGDIQVLAVNLNTVDAGVVTNNYSSFGNPSFSVGTRPTDVEGAPGVYLNRMTASEVSGGGQPFTQARKLMLMK